MGPPIHGTSPSTIPASLLVRPSVEASVVPEDPPSDSDISEDIIELLESVKGTPLQMKPIWKPKISITLPRSTSTIVWEVTAMLTVYQTPIQSFYQMTLRPGRPGTRSQHCPPT